MGWYDRFVSNHPFANVTFAVILLLGAWSYTALPREQDPEINFNWVQVTTVLPGASAEDVEARVTKPLEDAIKTLSDVRFVLSSSREAVSSILVRFREIDERAFDKRINDLRRELTAKRSELPPEVRNDPQVLEITTSNGFPTAQVLVVGQANDDVLRRATVEARDGIERLAGVDRAGALGLREPELLVEFVPQRAAARGLRGTDVADAVAGWFRDTFAGTTEAGKAEWLVRVLGQRADPDYVADLTVAPRASAANGTRPPATRLADLGEVRRSRAEPTMLVSYEGRPAALLSVTKKSGVNTLELVDRIHAYIDERNPVLAASGVRLVLLDDQTIPTREAIGVMESNALLGLVLVIAVCWVFLGTRISLLVGLGIPFSLAGTFGILYALGYTLNVSVLLGIVIVLGMLVDDAVVVVEAIYYRLQRGEPIATAVVAGAREVAAPVVSSVATTMAAFLPLMLLPGIVGKFMFVIPFVVTLALAISLVEAFWMLPAHVAGIRPDFSRPGRVQRWRNRFEHMVRLRYSQALTYVLRRPKRFLALAALFVAGAAVVVAAGAVRVQFFAMDPLRIFYLNVDMPAGSPIEATLAKVEEVEAIARRHLGADEARGVASYAGLKFTETEPVFGAPFGQVVVSLKPAAPGRRDAAALVDAMRKDVEATPGVQRISITQLSGGPPAAKPVRVRVRADDFRELRAAADELKRILERIEGTRDVVDDEVAGRPQFVLMLDPEGVRNAGLSAAEVARLVRLHVDGEIVSVMRDGGDKLEVRVRAHRGRTHDIASVLDDPVALPGGAVAPLGALATARPMLGRGEIRHYNFRRAITVEADLDKETIDTVAANKRLLAEWDKVRARHPAVSLDFSGELDDIQESLDAMAALFLLGVGLIYLILAMQFRSYWQPLMILVTVPLAFAGVAYGLLVAGNPLSLYTLYGVIALTGIAVNSAIVLIDAANARLASGMGIIHAAIYAARRRVVPILITSVTTLAGLFSLAFGIGGKSLLWGPVASAIFWGLTISTALTLFVIPLMYLAFMRRNAGRRAAAQALSGVNP
jgi:multidrug efflux pump subunit AcrB